MSNTNLDFLARMSDNPEIQELVRKAKLVRVEKTDTCVEVWTTDRDWAWQVRKSKKGELYCTCPSYRFSKGTRTCKHLTAVCSLLDIEDIPEYPGRKTTTKGESNGS